MISQSDITSPASKPEKISFEACLAALKRFPSISVLIVLGIIGCVLAYCLFDQVFASASINLKYTKAEILTMAKDKLKSWGYETTGTKSKIEFENDKHVKTFLEQSFGQAEANRLMTTVPVWYWECTFEKDKEPTSTISLDPEGQLKRFDRTLPNDMRLPSLDRKAAELLAISFAKKETEIDLSNWKLVQSRDVKLQDRTDHTFTWSDPSSDYHGADKRIEITVSGDKVSVFKFYIHVPESWMNQFKLSRSYNELFSTVAWSLFYLFYLGAAVVFIRGIIKKTFSYKTALTFGAICALGEFLGYLSAPIDVDGPWYRAGVLIVMLAMSVGWGLGMAVLFAAAQPLYRQLCPERWPLKDWFTYKMLRSPELIQGMLLGFAVCFFSMGYQVLYYLVGEQVGFWCPLQGQSFGTLNLPYPFLLAMRVGIHASFHEEILFRVIGLVLLQKLFRGNFWIANLLQAAIWGFAHSTYPQQPAYARGLELTIEGMFSGWLIKRFGLIPNIVSHYLFDAILTVSILRSAPASVAITGLIPIAVPGIVLAISLAVSAWKGLVYPPLMTAEKARKTAEFFKLLTTTMGRPVGFEYNTLSKRAVIKLVVLSAMCLSAILLLRSYIPLAGAGIKPLQIKRAYAVEAATTLLRNLNLSLDGCVVTPQLLVIDENDADTLRTAAFIRSQSDSYARTKELLEKLYSTKWSVTFQKTASPVSYTVKFDQAGNFKAPAFVTAEDTPGANLTEAEARQVAEKFFAKHQWEWLPIEFLDSETSKKANRTDYSFNFTVPQGKAGKADLLATITVQGDLVTRLDLGYRIFDTWLKSYRNAPANTRQSALSAVFEDNYLLIGLSLLLFFFLWREGHVRWKLAFACAAALAILDFARSCNTLPRFYGSYDGNSPLPTFVTTKLLAWAKAAVKVGVGWTLYSALALAVINKYFKRSYLEGAFSFALGVRADYERSAQRRFWIDAILIATCVILACQASTVIGQITKSAGLEPPIESIEYYLSSPATASAAFRIIAASLMTALTYLYLSIFLPAMTHKFLRGKRWLVCIVIFLCACCYCLQFAHTGGGGLLVAFFTTLWLFAFIFTLFFVGRRNFLASALVLWWNMLLPAVVTIAQFAFPLMIFDWCILLGLCLLPILWLIYLQIAPPPEVLALQEATSGIKPPEPPDSPPQSDRSGNDA